WISPLQTSHLLDVPSSNTWRCPHIALSAIPAYAVCSRLRLESADSPQHSAESGSLSYGPPVRLRLLSTSPHGDAVTFDYEVMACLDADLHRADVMPSRAHGLRPPPERRRWVSNFPRTAVGVGRDPGKKRRAMRAEAWTPASAGATNMGITSSPDSSGPTPGRPEVEGRLRIVSPRR